MPPTSAYTPINPAEVRSFPTGLVVPSIKEAIDKAAAEIPHGKKGAIIAFVDDDGTGPKTDGAGLAAYVNLGHGLTFVGTLKKPWNGVLEKEAKLVFAF